MLQTAAKTALCVLAPGLLLISCGDGKSKREAEVREARANMKAWGQPRETAPLDPASGGLVPEDASGLIHCRDPQSFLTQLKAVLSSFQPGMGGAISFDPIVLPLGVRTSDLDLSRPATVAIATDGENILNTVVLAAKDVEETEAAVEMPTATADRMVAIGIGTEPRAGSPRPAIGEALPAGDLVVHLDLTRLGKAWIPQLRANLTKVLTAPEVRALPPQVSSLLTPDRVDSICDVLAQATELRASLSLKDGHFDLDVAVDVRPGSAFELREQTANPVDVAAALPSSDAPMMVMLGTNWNYILNLENARNQQIAARLAPEQAAQFLSATRNNQRFYRASIGFGAFTFAYGADGLAALAALGSPRPDAFVNAYVKLMHENPASVFPPRSGVTATNVEDIPLLGTSFLTADLATDKSPLPEGLPPQQQTLVKANRLLARALIGKDTLRLMMGAAQPFALIATGIPDRVSNIVTKLAKSIEMRATTTPANPILTHVVDRLHAVPTWLIAADARAALAGLRGSIASFQKIPEPPAGEPVPIWVSISASGARYELQAHADLGGLAQLVAAMNKAK